MGKLNPFLALVGVVILITLPLTQADLTLWSDNFEDGSVSDWTKRTDGIYVDVDRQIVSGSPISGSYSMNVYDTGSIADIGGVYHTLGTSLDSSQDYNITFTINNKVATSTAYFNLGDTVTDGSTNRGHLFFLYQGDIYYWTALGVTKDSGYNYNIGSDFTFNYLFNADSETCELYIDGVRADTGDCFHDNYNYNNPKFQVNDFASGSRIGIYLDDIVFNQVLDGNYLLISAKNNITDTTITTFNSSLYNSANTLVLSNTTTSGLLTYDLTSYPLDNYTVTFESSSYKNTNTTINWLNSSQSYQFSTRPSPSINITVRDVLTNDLINNVSFVFDGEQNYFTSNTTTGNYYSSSLNSDYYRILPSATGYASNNYYINLTPNTLGIINAYLFNSSNTNEIDVTLQDTSQVALQDALVSVYFRNGTSLKLVGTGRSNIIGKTTFNLNPDYTHTFIIQASGYETKTFNYLPTEDITVTLTDTITVTYETILDSISYSYTPTNNYLTATGSQDFTFTVSDSNSQIQSFSLSFYNGSETVTGSSSGGVATLNVNTSNYVDEALLFYYNITRIDGETFQTTHSYYILGAEAGNTTGQYAFTNTSYSSRALSMLAVLLIAMLMLGLAKSGFSGLLITIAGVFGLALFTWLGWVNAWLGYSAVIISILYLLFRGGLFE